MGTGISVRALEKRLGAHTEEVRKAAEACLFVLRRSGARVDVYLVGDREMKRINREFRGKNIPTNVLSFEEPKAFPHPEEGGREFLGEVYLAPDYIKKKREDITALVIHGVLHLVGYTHGRVRDKMEMENKEEEVVKHLRHVKSTHLP